MKKGKASTAVIVILVIVLVLALGGTGAFYALSDGTFDPAVVTNIFMSSPTEPPTEPPTKAVATEPPTEAVPELTAKISAKEIDVSSGSTAQITAKVKGGKGQYNVRYTTSNENIAAVDAQGVVTPMSKGECKVGAYIEGYDTTIKNFTITVTDQRIDEINVLNSYLFSLSPKEDYTYAGGKKGVAKLKKCKIGDFNSDGSYELFVIYSMSNSLQKARVVTVSNGTAVVNETDRKFADIVSGGYSSYTEEIYLDPAGNISILAEFSKVSAEFSEKTSQLFTTGYGASMTTEYYCKEPNKLGDMAKKAVYKVDDQKKERDEYTTLYTSMKTSRELFSDYIPMFERLSEGNYTKANMPADIGTAYYNRIKWTSSDGSVATVSDSGIITGGKRAGTCTITGTIPEFETPFCKITVEVSDVSDEFADYIDEIKNQTIVGSAGNQMQLYGYYVMDLDSDGTTDLLLYYTGGNGCQLDMMHFVGTNPSRQTIFSTTTENGTSCLLELYTDSMNNNASMLYVANITKTSSKLETRFSYEAFENGGFVPSASEYTYIENTATGKKEYRVGGEKVEQNSFNDMLNRYRKIGDWTLVK